MNGELRQSQEGSQQGCMKGDVTARDNRAPVLVRMSGRGWDTPDCAPAGRELGHLFSSSLPSLAVGCSRGVNPQHFWPDPHAAWAGRETSGPGAVLRAQHLGTSVDQGDWGRGVGTNAAPADGPRGKDHQPEAVSPQGGTWTRQEVIITQAGKSKGWRCF